MKSTAPADCVTEIRIGNSVLVVSGFFKQSATETAADKMAKVLEAVGFLHKNRQYGESGKEAFSPILPLYTPPRHVGTIEVRNN